MSQPEIKVLDVTPQQLFNFLRNTSGPESHAALIDAARRSLEAMLSAIGGVNYEVEIKIRPYWKSETDDPYLLKMRERHAAELEARGVPLLNDIARNALNRCDMDAMSKVSDIVKQLDDLEAGNDKQTD